MKISWDLPIKHADECRPCEFCEEPFCDECGAHYFECAHAGPTSEREEDEDIS